MHRDVKNAMARLRETAPRSKRGLTQPELHLYIYLRDDMRVILLKLSIVLIAHVYRAEKKGWYVVARYFFLFLLSFSAWPCLAVA